MSITERIFKLLELQGISQYKLAKEIGVSDTRISQWKKRNGAPHADLIAPICAFLGVSEHYLLTGEKDEEKDKIDTHLLSLFHSMNDEGKEKALEQLEFFASKYKKHSSSKVVSK